MATAAGGHITVSSILSALNTSHPDRENENKALFFFFFFFMRCAFAPSFHVNFRWVELFLTKRRGKKLPRSRCQTEMAEGGDDKNNSCELFFVLHAVCMKGKCCGRKRGATTASSLLLSILLEAVFSSVLYSINGNPLISRFFWTFHVHQLREEELRAESA